MIILQLKIEYCSLNLHKTNRKKYYHQSSSQDGFSIYRYNSPKIPQRLGNNVDFPGDSLLKNSPADAGDDGSIPGLGRSLREGNGNSLLA